MKEQSQESHTTYAAMAMNEQGKLLPYTCQSTISQCEEYCQQHILAWDKLKELGARVVPVQILEHVY